jgi:AcrR family transcriptional regulator
MSEPTTRAARRAATSRKIIEAAQHEFGEHGFEATTVRAIARRAGIDPSLVIQHYGSKEHLFRIATELPSDAYAIAVQLPAGTPREELVAHLLDVLAVRLGTPPPETRALVRSMLTSPAATAEMKAYLDERVANLSRALGGPDAELRAAMAVSSILGVTIARHYLELDALTGAAEEQLADLARSWLAALLNATEHPSPSGPVSDTPPTPHP